MNNAGVIAFGRFEETPPDVFGRVVQTDLFGVVNGCRAVLPHFLDRGEGVIVNVASIVSQTGQRYATAYAAAFFGEVNALAGVVRGGTVDTPVGRLAVEGHACGCCVADGSPVEVLVRPEALKLAPLASPTPMTDIMLLRFTALSAVTSSMALATRGTPPPGARHLAGLRWRGWR